MEKVDSRSQGGWAYLSKHQKEHGRDDAKRLLDREGQDYYTNSQQNVKKRFKRAPRTSSTSLARFHSSSCTHCIPSRLQVRVKPTRGKQTRRRKSRPRRRRKRSSARPLLKVEHDILALRHDVVKAGGFSLLHFHLNGRAFDLFCVGSGSLYLGTLATTSQSLQFLNGPAAFHGGSQSIHTNFLFLVRPFLGYLY